MSGVEDIPRSVKYDLLLIIIGIILIISPLYFKDFFAGNEGLKAILIVIGLVMTINGLGKAGIEYSMDIELKEIEYIEEKLKFIDSKEGKALLKPKAREKILRDLIEKLNER